MGDRIFFYGGKLLIYPSYQGPIPIVASSSENITVDKWYRALSEPSVKTKLRTAEYPAFVYGPRPIVQTVDRWWQNLATPPKAKPRTTEYPYLAFSPTQPTPSDQIGWYRPLAEPRKLFKDRTVEFPFFAYGTPPIVSGPDRWWQNLATPPKAKPRTVQFPAFTYGAPSIVQTVDRWWQNLATPPKAKPRAAEYSFTSLVAPIQPQSDDGIAWYEPFHQPQRKKLGLDFQMQESLYRAPLIVYGPRTMGYIIS